MSLPRVKVPLVLDKPRTLVLSLNALCKAEEVTGVSLLVGQPTFSSIRMLRALVWAGLLWEDPLLQIEAVGDLIEEASADYVLTQIMLAYQNAMPDEDPDAEEDDDDESDPPNSPLGEDSGPLDESISV